MRRPRVSVILPVYRAQATLPRALASVARCGLPPGLVEIVIASDDGIDYRPLLPATQRFALTRPGPLRSGPGAARNRALRLARGEVIAFLDADDSWAPGYLAALLPLARRHGAAFGRTVVTDRGRELLRLGPEGGRLTLADLGRAGGSFHPVLARAHLAPFTDLPAQDVRHAAELLARLGGAAPLAATDYRLHLRPGSLTAAGDFARRIARAYDRHIAGIGADRRHDPAMRESLARVFRDKARLNAAYLREARPGEGFYPWLARHLSHKRAEA